MAKRRVVSLDLTGVDDDTLEWFKGLKPAQRAEALQKARGRRPAILGVCYKDGTSRRFVLPDGPKEAHEKS